MRTADYPEPFRALVQELRRLPGVGPRSAERMALWLLEDGERPSALARTLEVAKEELRHCRECGFFSVEESCVICAEAGREALHGLGTYLNTLGTIATAAPLLGLLGTVVGMIEIFAAQAPGTGGANPQQLAHGISVALYNTAFGLIVAIPALLFYRYFRGVVNEHRLTIEVAAERMIPQLLRHTVSRTTGGAA